jgi:hypothetical protein
MQLSTPTVPVLCLSTTKNPCFHSKESSLRGLQRSSRSWQRVLASRQSSTTWSMSIANRVTTQAVFWCLLSESYSWMHSRYSTSLRSSICSQRRREGISVIMMCSGFFWANRLINFQIDTTSTGDQPYYPLCFYNCYERLRTLYCIHDCRHF